MRVGDGAELRNPLAGNPPNSRRAVAMVSARYQVRVIPRTLRELEVASVRQDLSVSGNALAITLKRSRGGSRRSMPKTAFGGNHIAVTINTSPYAELFGYSRT